MIDIMRTHKTTSKLLLVVLFLGSPFLLHANELDAPFVSANRSPFIQIYGLPSATNGKLVDANASLWKLQLESASNATLSNTNNENILLDGESHRINLQFRYGLTTNFELGFELPYISHEGGGLDSFIDSWHHLFSLPEGIRPSQTSNQFQYFYQQGSDTIYDLNRSSAGIGDIRFNAAYQLSTTADRQWALRSGIKLATGDAQYLHGSESTDVYISAHVSDHSLLQATKMTLHASAGALWMSSGKVLDQSRQDWVIFASSTLSWRYKSGLHLKAQLDYHSAFYDSALKQLGASSAQLVLGAAIQINEKWLLDLSVSEDIILNTAPDAVFQLGFTLKP